MYDEVFRALRELFGIKTRKQKDDERHAREVIRMNELGRQAALAASERAKYPKVWDFHEGRRDAFGEMDDRNC